MREIALLHRKGLISKKIDPAAKSTPATRRAIRRYSSVLRGKASVVTAPSRARAQELRGKLGLTGSGKAVIVPRYKGERVKINAEGKIVGTRKQYGQTVKREINQRANYRPPAANERVYYTIPSRKRGTSKLKRKTFSSLDEMLYYLEKYEVDFEEIEDYIEVEYYTKGGRKDKQLRERYTKEREAAYKRLTRARKPHKKRNKKKTRPSGRGR